MVRTYPKLALLVLLLVANSAMGQAESPSEKDATAPKGSEQTRWRSLFNGRDLGDWKSTEFGGEGEVYVENGEMVIDFGSSLSGITFAGKDPIPKSNYELRIEAQRADGIDFFCGLTFPVKESHCSLIVGGWGGALVGLSSIDGVDASENETRTSMRFKQEQWYTIRVRVLDDKITVWIDDKSVIDQSIVDRKISIRPEVVLSRPLGIATWDTRAKLRRIDVRSIAPESRESD